MERLDSKIEMVAFGKINKLDIKRGVTRNEPELTPALAIMRSMLCVFSAS